MPPVTEDLSGFLDLYRSKNLVVRLVAADDCDRWVITFDNYGIGHGFDRPGFGQAWLKAQGVSAIHVMGRAEDWYQYTDIDEALATVRAAVSGASRVVTYGSSMGGYAAVRFADAVGAHAVLALSAQYTLDPEVAPHDRRWSQDVDRIAWRPELGGPLRCGAQVVVVYDPYSLDGWHGRRIVADTGAAEIRLPHTAHPVTSFLSDIGLLGDVLLRLLDDELDTRAFRREARARRGDSGVYLGELALQQTPRRLGLALQLARRAVAAHPSSLHARVCLSRLLGRARLHDEALEHLEMLVTTSGRALSYLPEYGYGLALAGHRAKARAILDEVLAQHPESAHLHGWAASVHWANQDTGEARAMIAEAIRLDPGLEFYRETASLYRKKSFWTRVSGWFARQRQIKGQARATADPFLSSSEPAN